MKDRTVRIEKILSDFRHFLPPPPPLPPFTPQKIRRLLQYVLIDLSIRSYIERMNIMGYKTIYSCGGHLGDDRPYPDEDKEHMYVLFAPSDEKRFMKVANFIESSFKYAGDKDDPYRFEGDFQGYTILAALRKRQPNEFTIGLTIPKKKWTRMTERELSRLRDDFWNWFLKNIDVGVDK